MTQRREEIVPVYLVTGFLESGKTSLIHSMLEDDSFSRGQKTLILSCEEGEVPYDTDLMNDQNTVVVSFEEPEEMTAQRLVELQREHKPERIIMEYNSVWGVEPLAKTPMPMRWRMVQVINMVDATTFDNYMTNMRKLLTDTMKEADLVLFNRCEPGDGKSGWRRQVRALNPRCNIIFENIDGTTEDGVADEDLPYDMKADIITIPEEDLGTFYIDSMDHPGRYDGKTVRFTGQYFPDQGLPKGYGLIGRLAMTCCADDIARVGWICQYKKMYGASVFVRLTAKCRVMDNGGQEMLMLEEIDSEKGMKPKEPYMTFN